MVRGHGLPMASLRLLFTAFLAALMLAAVPNASAIVNGSPDGNRHPFVVFVGQQFQTPDGVWRNANACSGALVSPTVVLTAAHCTLLPPGFPPFPIRYLVFKGETITAPEAVVPASSVTVHPQFCQGLTPPGTPCPGGVENLVTNDLAVLVLPTAMSGPYAKLPKAESLGHRFRKARQTTIVGFGVTEPRVPGGPPVGIGVRRNARAEAQVFSAAPTFLQLPPPSRSKYGTPCQGDSGGPVLSGRRNLLAILSIGETDCGGPTYAYRLDTASARSFLANFVDLRGDRRGGDDDDDDEDDDDRGKRGGDDDEDDDEDDD
jgi:hypothetical protein